jgi:inorganic phosphate transporter, PiT family
VEYYVLLIVVVALIFDFINGFHDSANSIATIVGTRVLSPLAAVVWAATFNFAAAFVVGTAVAKAVATGFVDVNIVDQNVVFGGLIGAIVWNLITWWFGIPSSSSHALIGGYAGAAISKAGLAGLTFGKKWIETLSAIILSPLGGILVGFILMVIVFNTFKNVRYATSDRFFRVMQLVSSAALSLAHGANDAQKTMGIILGLLVASKSLFAGQPGFFGFFYVENSDVVPLWVELSAYTMISLGTLFGGWRIVHTMGTRITKLRPVGGFCAEDGWRGGDPHRLEARHSDLHHTHHHRCDRGRRCHDATAGGALGPRRTHRVGVGAHHSGGGADGGPELPAARPARPDWVVPDGSRPAPGRDPRNL